MNLDENQKQAFIAMQFNAQRRQYVMSYPHADSSVILSNEAPIGRLLVDRGEREFTLVDIVLLPTHCGAGIGTYLIKDLLLAAAAEAKPVKLSVWHMNPAKSLYERLGFSIVNSDGVYCEMMCVPSTEDE
jgi:ribosomal protein S18 acetylase RimI-like enzyme